MQKTKVSVFKTVRESQSPLQGSLSDILDGIKTGGKLREKLESLPAMGDKDRARAKTSLPVVIFGGVFNHRAKSGLAAASGLIVLDFDHIEDLDSKRAEITSKPYTLACFKSPSGDGLKAVVKIPVVKDDAEYKSYYYGLMEEFEELDTSGKDISRACFFAYDPDIYVNYECGTFTSFKKTDPSKKREGRNILEVAVSMIRYAEDGEKHHVLLKASRLCGGFVAGGMVDEDDAFKALLDAISAKANVTDLNLAEKTIRDGISNGRLEPLTRAIEMLEEARFVRKANGEYDFLASESDMDDYLFKYVEGKIEFGLPTFMGNMDTYYRFKHNTFTLVAGLDNVGKSFFLWYLRVVAAMYHGHKTLILSSENRDATLKRKILEFYVGIKITDMTQDQRREANEFYKEHFKIISSERDIYTAKEVLDIATEMYMREWGEYDCVVVEPYNSLDVTSQNEYRYHYKVLAQLRLFAMKYCSVMIAAHVHSNAARRKDNEGYVDTPIKADVEGGQQFANRVDDFIMFHRIVNHDDPIERRVGNVHVQKVKETETGGKPTPKDSPVRIKANEDLCGFAVIDTYSAREVDAVKLWWESRSMPLPKGVTPPTPPEKSSDDPLGGMFNFDSTDGEPF